MRARSVRPAPFIAAVRASEPAEDTVAAVAAFAVVSVANAIAAPATTEFDSEEGPRWPDEATESAFLAEQKTEVAPPPPPAAPIAPAVTIDEGPLPNLQNLVDRIPLDAKAALDELFRARFVSVKRIPEKALK